jgi:hypothetical protein
MLIQKHSEARGMKLAVNLNGFSHRCSIVDKFLAKEKQQEFIGVGVGWHAQIALFFSKPTIPIF